jgi:DNA-directed RNA polymerase subunit RPC12/RpoP
MRHLKTYKIFEISKVKEITCDNCDWNWKIEINDDRKYLCHRCGYDNELKEFDMKALKEWQNKNPEVELPFIEKHVSENTYIREFKQETDSGEFMWHRDREDRTIESIEETDWMIQIDNQLPKVIEGKIKIPMGVYHRLIKGNGNLIIKLIKK